ncbi:tRNA (adenosine(37)-N6)-threonylcarbamoyltransferase complex dimerization subunit type 1 TsaB [Marivivens donghaensis]|uniref:tRNA (Adenosine(37)-N6)-threonylcarbamoyltransferase complex dimerization subunit type 1 TsaB n=1 Tax=Marivivens donghaensis TaxID=1699413 RepID=A0ABX0VTV7_9RHOB|nr:tRNA (adenosine(37)-N6)-threonylcarbamoyltransferase complex dimerization subunit type 1 TsaB [Marivivens donghaensis]NIY71179.1 tRNA (adenosine(37)-N6)-threonylcarbamoyltransferase complex dimerization subunit type 1 TsaB [Marivivens donghaensis]
MRFDRPVLAFDTSAAHCAAALLLTDGTVHTRVEEMSKGQAERLMPLVEELLAEHGLKMSDLGAIGVGIGPGNFTGIRISVSAARGIALGLGIPAIGVDGFDARAFGHSAPVTTVIAAPRGQVYARDDNGAPEMRSAEDPSPYPVVPEPTAHQLIENVALIAVERATTDQPRPAPLYVRAADAAPPRDAAPKILT